MRKYEIKNEIDEIKKWENKIKRKDLKFETNRYIFDFQRFEKIRSFDIYNGKININEAEMKQTNLLANIVELSNKSRPRSKKEKDKKQNTLDTINALYEGRYLILMLSEAEYFHWKKNKEND